LFGEERSDCVNGALVAADVTHNSLDRLKVREHNNAKSHYALGPTTNHHMIAIDSGASCHMTPFRDMFKTFSNDIHDKMMIRVGDGRNIVATGVVEGFIEGFGRILYVPELKLGLYSVSQFQRTGVDVTFSRGGCIVKRSNGHGIFSIFNAINGLYLLGEDDVLRVLGKGGFPAHQESSTLILK